MLLKDILNKLFWGVDFQLHILDKDFQVVEESNICKVITYNKFDNFVAQFLDYEINGIDVYNNIIIFTILKK